MSWQWNDKSSWRPLTILFLSLKTTRLWSISIFSICLMPKSLCKVKVKFINYTTDFHDQSHVKHKSQSMKFKNQLQARLRPVSKYCPGLAWKVLDIHYPTIFLNNLALYMLKSGCAQPTCPEYHFLKFMQWKHENWVFRSTHVSPAQALSENWQRGITPKILMPEVWIL